MSAEAAAPESPPGLSPVRPILGATRSNWQQGLVWAFVVAPMLALLATVPVMWGWGLGWYDVAIAAVFYVVGILGVTVGYHRHFTHKSFKARPWLRIMLAISGSLAIQGSVMAWVADHRRHHAYSDKEGDPHSPWRYGTSPTAVAKGFFWSHVGWLFERRKTNYERFIPDLLADRAVRRVSKLFGLWVAVSLILPAALGGLLTWSWAGVLTGFFWGGLVRTGLVHHVTWSINSICHMVGRRPFRSRDRSRNFWPLAILSMGESWHNLHHADPTCARHGVLPGQIDISARVIWLFERFGWVHEVRWPTTSRLTKLRAR
ncbi:acyl-CoA desaturase [Pseudonocardia asaccharolytica]|uniref:Stearoyl-CoA desaturase n=1 Tax=Pseudonocardia asaccharolytica DSM 44247 = NBRC 16224 TaxID=1123024 RepID=A0A511D760_9PSEU|nr:acyl-CoA desaturase [Pseudonocardia asaccharolytica]GEL18798.1 stearoyl-CoA desaturase [Pseudonocardia asaccharolytica DSM 44247 = NBRC 16224]